MYVRVHFAKTQVQLPLDQHSSIPREYGMSVHRCEVLEASVLYL